MNLAQHSSDLQHSQMIYTFSDRASLPNAPAYIEWVRCVRKIKNFCKIVTFANGTLPLSVGVIHPRDRPAVPRDRAHGLG